MALGGLPPCWASLSSPADKTSAVISSRLEANRPRAWSGAILVSRSATSISVRMAVSGVRSSCEASAVNRLLASKADSIGRRVRRARK